MLLATIGGIVKLPFKEAYGIFSVNPQRKQVCYSIPDGCLFWAGGIGGEWGVKRFLADWILSALQFLRTARCKQSYI